MGEAGRCTRIAGPEWLLPALAPQTHPATPFPHLSSSRASNTGVGRQDPSRDEEWGLWEEAPARKPVRPRRPKAEAGEDGVAVRISADSAGSGPSSGPSRAEPGS